MDSTAAALRLGSVPERLGIGLAFERLDLTPGDYVLDVGVYPPDWRYAYDFHWHVYRVRVTGEGGDAVFMPGHRWELR